MTHLFSKIVLKDALKNVSISDIESKIGLLQEWNEMYRKGELQKKKETAFEATYSEKLFGTILGYTDVSGGIYTREKHPKNASNGQTCDIGLGYYSSEKNETQAVVELKDAGTSIDRPQQREGNMTPIQQGFKYKPLYNSRWVIVSNYYEIRLYRDTYQDYEVWTLADLVNPLNDYEKFRIFYFLLRAESLIAETGESETEKLLAKVRIEQETITKKFYKEYSGLREELMRDIWKNNPTLRNESVVTITQRIIDRIVFVHFCEDRGLLPQNKLAENLTRAKEIDLTPWEVLMLYFRGIDKGSEKLGIPNGYNGGLFHDENDIIKNLKVSDDVITKFIELGRYDFSDEGGQLSVEILGHIFEQSISDLESIREKIKNPGGESEEKKVSKRKKDGIFYTPAYIVDYIVRNSLGKYLEEHEERLKEQFKLKGDINEKNYRKRELEAYTEYQKILHNVKVLDPACGSGAFLVRVFDFLIAENVRVEKILSGDEQTLSLAERDPSAFFGEILKNNIYGVDLNEESVEITKLSLWLKSAVRGKKLETLDHNIKCGNSLIDDPAVAGDKAFNWKTEFADIMASGGFDVIVGNPPYISYYSRQSQSDKKTMQELEYFIQQYSFISNKDKLGRFNTVMFFIEKMQKLSSSKSKVGIIIDTNIHSNPFIDTRKFLLKNFSINKLVDEISVFEGVASSQVILILDKNNAADSLTQYDEITGEGLFLVKGLIKITGDNDFSLKFPFEKNIKTIIDKYYSYNSLQDYVGKENIRTCITFTGQKDKFVIDKAELPIDYPLVEGGFSLPFPYCILTHDKFIRYDLSLRDSLNKEYIELAAAQNKRSPMVIGLGDLNRFLSPKIFIRLSDKRITATYSEEKICADLSLYICTLNNLSEQNDSLSLKYILALLNSSLTTFIARKNHVIKNLETGTPQIRLSDVRDFGIPNKSLSEQQPLIEKADQMLSLNRDLQEKSSSFFKNIQAKYSVSKITRKLEKWWELDFVEFLKETKISVSLAEQEELMQYFETRRAEVRAIDAEIRKTDTEIDNMVFDLYGLTEEERKIVINT